MPKKYFLVGFNGEFTKSGSYCTDMHGDSCYFKNPAPCFHKNWTFLGPHGSLFFITFFKLIPACFQNYFSYV